MCFILSCPPTTGRWGRRRGHLTVTTAASNRDDGGAGSVWQGRYTGQLLTVPPWALRAGGSGIGAGAVSQVGEPSSPTLSVSFFLREPNSRCRRLRLQEDFSLDGSDPPSDSTGLVFGGCYSRVALGFPTLPLLLADLLLWPGWAGGRAKDSVRANDKCNSVYSDRGPLSPLVSYHN